jgi:hypothetical protein
MLHAVGDLPRRVSAGEPPVVNARLPAEPDPIFQFLIEGTF